MRNFLLMFIIQFSVITVAFSAPTVTDVVVKAGYPCVDITCNVSGIDGEYKFDVSATLPDIGISKCIVAETGESIGDFIVRANGQYHLIWDARAELGEVRYANLVVRVTLQEVDKVQLWDGGPCWAIKNIGAEKPWERGYYFWWGDTIGYKFENDKWVASDGSNSNFSFTIRNTPTEDMSLSTLKSEGWITSDDVLSLDYDAGYMHLGDDWRMPTKQELEALLTECDWTWVNTNDICGYVVRGKDKYISRSIFLPATGYLISGTYLRDVNLRGYYWSQNPDDNNRKSYYLYFYASSVGRNVQSNSERYEGKPIRPVSESVKIILAGQSAVFSLDTRDVLRVTNVVAKQRYPWNGLVDLTCNVTGIEGECKFVVSAILPDTGNVNRLSTCVIAETGVNTSDFLIKTNGLYHLIWDAKAELGEVWYTNMVLRVGLERFKVQLWEGGPYWATTNIGADKSWESGLYFWWGDAVGYKRENDKWVASDGSNSNFSFSSGNTPTYRKSTSTLKSEGWITADGVLTPEHDAAHVHWGNDWRMPTTNDWHMLINNCDLEFSKVNGVNGYIVRGRGSCAANSIFLPITGIGDGASRGEGSAGYYWASVPYLSETTEDFGQYGWGFYITERYKYRRNSCRYYGIPIRPVSEATGEIYHSITLNSCGGEGNVILSRVEGSILGKLPTLIRDGYIFDGWWTSASGGEQVLASTIVTGSVIYYAHWYKEPEGVQLWEGGPYWASANIGAGEPWERGYYFWWGDTIGYKWENNKWVASDGSNPNFSFSSSNTPTYDKSISTLKDEGWITADGVLTPEHDAAHVHWGNDWRMPTNDEFAALINNCDWTRCTTNGVTGSLICGRGEFTSKSIFLPAAGIGTKDSLGDISESGSYWTSIPIYNYDANLLMTRWAVDVSCTYSYRFSGRSIRPVRVVAK